MINYFAVLVLYLLGQAMDVRILYKYINMYSGYCSQVINDKSIFHGLPRENIVAYVIM